jgi:hypothetical protein
MGAYSTVVEAVYVWSALSVFLHGKSAWAYRSMLAIVFLYVLEQSMASRSVSI